MKLAFSTIVATLALTATSFAATFGPLVNVDELNAARATKAPVLLDIRSKGYQEGHIEGAVSAPYSIFRGPAENPGQVPDVEALEAELEKLGLEQDDTIVVVTDGQSSSDFGAAARVYWTLKSTGFTDLSILNGGHAAWAEAGYAISDTAPTVTPSELELSLSDQWLADTAHVSSVVKGDKQAVLIDARPEDFFLGKKAHNASKKPGTLPNAINHEFSTFFNQDAASISEVKDPQKLLADLGIVDDQEVVSFCNTGHWAATHWFAMSELAGVKNAKLYAGSMVEYSNADLEMSNTPGLLQNLINQITK
jgi:thiosulfate/3-mercaptopyruvate sulfurtransferase